MTQWVMAATLRAAEAQEAEWADRLYVPINDLEAARVELSARADALRGLSETDYSRWCEWLGETPNEGGS